MDGPTESCGTEHAVGGSHEHCIHIHMNIHDICIVIGGWNVTMDGKEALPIVRALVQDVVREQKPDFQVLDSGKHHQKDDNSTISDDENNDDFTLHVHLNIHDIHIYIPVLTPSSSSSLLPITMRDPSMLDDQTKRIQFADEVGRFVNAVRLKSFAQRLTQRLTEVNTDGISAYDDVYDDDHNEPNDDLDDDLMNGVVKLIMCFFVGKC